MDANYTAILLDGTQNPVSIRLGRKDRTDSDMNYPPKSISWSGGAINKPRGFNFVSEAFRNKGAEDQQEVRVYLLAGLKLTALVPPNLLDADGKEMTLEQQGAQMVDEFLYPEKYKGIGVFK
jgi:hypothetical protein